jgi:hypothetical protein
MLFPSFKVEFRKSKSFIAGAKAQGEFDWTYGTNKLVPWLQAVGNGEFTADLRVVPRYKPLAT